MEPRAITASAGKDLLLLAVSSAFVAVFVYLAWQGDTSATTLLGGGFFLLGVVVSGWTLLRPFTLVLDDQGWTLSGGTTRKPLRMAWSDLSEVFVYRVPKGGTMIGYNVKEYARTPGMTLSRALGADGAIPGSWPMKKAELAALLEQYRQFHAG